MITLAKSGGTLTAAVLALGVSLVIGLSAASAAPNSDAYRASATGPTAAPITERLEVVRAPVPGRAAATEARLRTTFERTIRRTDVVEAPRPGRGRM